MKKYLFYILILSINSCNSYKKSIIEKKQEGINKVHEAEFENVEVKFSKYIDLFITSAPYRISETDSSLYKINCFKFYKNGEYKTLSLSTDLKVNTSLFIDSVFDYSGKYKYDGKQIEFSEESDVQVTNLNTGFLYTEKYICDYLIQYVEGYEKIILKTRNYSVNWVGDFPWNHFEYYISR
jgi:hypothetical protein